MSDAIIKVRTITTRDNPLNAYQDIFIENWYASEFLGCESIPETAKELYLYVKEYGSLVARDIIDCVERNQKDIYIDGKWYSYEQVQEWKEFNNSLSK